jgi:organic radical activating enzyme
MENYCVVTHLKCNWNCKYCVVIGLVDVKLSEKQILNNMRERFKGKDGHFCLSGGEPGLLSESFFDELMFDILKDKSYVAVLTNGVFLDRDYHKRYKHRINDICLHVVEELDKPISDSNLSYIHNVSNVTPSIVVHSKNIDLVRLFLLKYNNIKFQIMLSFICDDNSYNIKRNDYSDLFKSLSGLKNFFFDPHPIHDLIDQNDKDQIRPSYLPNVIYEPSYYFEESSCK